MPIHISKLVHTCFLYSHDSLYNNDCLVSSFILLLTLIDELQLLKLQLKNFKQIQKLIRYFSVLSLSISINIGVFSTGSISLISEVLC